MMNAVAVQMIIVSTNTPSDWIRPCFTGCDTVAVAATLGTLPIPASLENSPRLTPLSSAAAMPPARFVPEIVSPYAGPGGPIMPGMSGGVIVRAVPARHQNAVMS